MGNWTWDARVSLICLLAAIAFAAGLLACTLLKKSKLVPTVGLACSLILMAGITLTAQLPNLLGGGLKPAAQSSSSAASAAVPAKTAQKAESTSSMSHMAYAELRLKNGTSQADAEMKRTESRFAEETTGSTSSSASSQASSAAVSSNPSSIRVLRAPGTVQRGNVAQLSIQGKGNTSYKIKVIYDSGSAGQGSEMSVQSDTFGRASWAWTVGKDIVPGAHFITITGGGETLTTSFTTA